MKIELKAEVTRTGGALPVAVITDFSGTNMTGRQEPEMCLAIATMLIESVRKTALKESATGRCARSALELFGLAEAADEAGEEEEDGTEPPEPRAKRTRS